MLELAVGLVILFILGESAWVWLEKSEYAQLAASKNVLDRAGFKPVARSGRKIDPRSNAADDRGGGDEPVVGFGHLQRVAIAADRSLREER